MKKKLIIIVLSILCAAAVFSACAPKKAGFTLDDDGATRYYRDGEFLAGWFDIDGLRYHFDDGGSMSVGWETIGGATFYFGEDGQMMTGTAEIEGVSCMFDEDGRAFTGLVQKSGEGRYYEAGKQKTGWVDIEGTRHYFKEDGLMATGLQEIGGETYLFDQQGMLCKGIFSISGKTMYFDDEGKLKDGLQVIDGRRYFFEEDGMAFGFRDIFESTYYFDPATGISLTGWQEIEGSRYYFSNDGIMARDVAVDGMYIGPEGTVQGASEGDGGPLPGGSAATGTKSGDDKLDSAIKEILDGVANGGMKDREKLEAAYKWVVDRMRYRFITVDMSNGYTRSLVYELAQYSADYRSGSCEHYAAVLYVLFERLGFKVMMVEGERWDHTNSTWGEHAWVIAEVGGKPYHFDPLFGRNHTNNAMTMFMAADSALEATHTWNRDFYPACG